MTRFGYFFMTLTLGLAGILAGENWAITQDVQQMRYSYGSFLASKAGGKPLGSMIRPGSLAVFQSAQGYVACAVMKGG